MQFNVGDKVRFLNDVGGGVVTKVIDRLTVTVMNEMEFEVPVKVKDLILIESADDYNDKSQENISNKIQNANAGASEIVIDTKNIFYPEVAIDKANADDLKLFLAFVPQGRPGNTDLDIYIINDSNYNVLYSIVNIIEGEKPFSNSAGILEANTKEHFESLALSSVNDIPEYIFHLVFYQKGAFELKEPLSKSIKINPVKFYKEKSYVENDFFNEDVLMFTIYTDNALLNEINNLSSNDLDKILKEKEKEEKKQTFYSAKVHDNELIEVDLHIHELVDDFRGLSNGEILEIQLDYFKSELEKAQKSKTRKMVFIHGVGNGTLKLEIRKELDRKNKQLSYQDASFKEYGYGATLVQFK